MTTLHSATAHTPPSPPSPAPNAPERIPRKIHYCWLSNQPIPRRLQTCINSWKRIMPDYELVLWNKERFDIRSVPFVEQACAARKWAFATDYIRWHALFHEGGIYMDTDVAAFRRFDRFLQHRAFASANYTHQELPTGERDPLYCVEAECIGAEAGHPWMQRCLKAYERQNFRLENNGIPPIGLAPTVLFHALPPTGWTGEHRLTAPLPLPEGITLYPEATFAWLGGDISLRHTHALHLAVGSWRTGEEFARRDALLPLRRLESRLCARSTPYAFLHYRRKRLLRRLHRLLHK